MGLFGTIGSTGRVSNLGLNGGSVNGGAVTGALAGSSAGTLSNVFSSAAVAGTSTVGGLVGELGAGGVIRDAYASGSVSASRDQAGGLVGNLTAGSIETSYASGATTATQGTAGGLVGGNIGGQISNSFWNINSTGLTLGSPLGTVGATGLTNTQAQTRSTFADAGWDMNKTWVVYDGVSGPYLRNFMTQLTYTADSAAKTYDGQAYVGGYTASSAGDARLIGSVVVGGSGAGAIDAGDYTLQLSGLASTGGQYGYSIHYVDGSLSVGKATLSQVGATVLDKVYDGTNIAQVNGATLNGVVARDVGRLTTTGWFDSKNVGNAISVSLGLGGEAAGNYILAPSFRPTARISRKDVIVTQVNADKVYDGSQGTNVHAAILQGVVDGERLGFTGSGIFSDRNVGAVKSLTIMGGSLTDITGSASNYRLVTPTGLTSAITARPVTISGITVSDKVYDGLNTATVNLSNVSFDGKVFSDNLSVGSAIGLFSDKNAGSNKVVNVGGLTLSGWDAGNYQLNFLPLFATASITPKNLTVSGITANNKVYDATTVASLNTANVRYDGLVTGDSVWVVSALGRFADKNVGNGKTVGISGVNLGGQSRDNYQVTGTATALADITPKSLSVSNITASNKVYDGGTQASLNLNGYRLDGLMAGDWVGLSGASGNFIDKNVGNGKAVNVRVSLLGGDERNYSMNNNLVLNANITPKDLSVNGITAFNKVYDGSTDAALNLATASFRELERGDDIRLGAATGRFNDKNAGAKNVSISDVTLSGNDAGNYRISGVGGANAFITPKALTVTGITADNKVYDASTTAGLNLAGAGFAGLVAGDQLSVGSASGRFSDKNAALGKNVDISAVSLTGKDARNYQASAQSTSADITPREVSVWGLRADSKVYDGTTLATLNLSNAHVEGLLWGDFATLSGATGRFADKNADSYKPVNVSDFVLGGRDAGNYQVGGMMNRVLADIMPKTLTVSGITAQNKVYDTNNHATLNMANAQLKGLIAGDQLALSAAHGFFSDNYAGADKAVFISGIEVAGSDARNYRFNPSMMTTADITKAAMTISVNDASKTQGQPNPIFGVTYQGLLGDDTVDSQLTGDLVFSTTATHSSAAGHYGVSASGQSADNYDIAYLDGRLTIEAAAPGTLPVPSPLRVPLQEVVSTVRPLHNLPTHAPMIAPAGPRHTNDLYTLIDQGLRLPEGL